MDTVDTVKQLRERAGLTQRELARLVGVHANTVARWERGEQLMPEATRRLLERLASDLPVHRTGDSPAGRGDPLFRAIAEALSGPVDDKLFESCAVDLLQPIWPGLAPVRGGSDSGFDGAIPIAHAAPAPLITTTSPGALRNLRKNLAAVRKERPDAQFAVFATSQRLTPQARKKLDEAANGVGLRLLQILDQDWFVEALYQAPRWRKKLLGVSGSPSALSIVPPSSRALSGELLIGRDALKERIAAASNDRVVIGQPGVGKTALLHVLALEGACLFADPSASPEDLADAIREQHPKAIVVDDAHMFREVVSRLMSLRASTGADYDIIALTWPGARSELAELLDIPSAAVFEVDLLDRDTMVQVIRSVGLGGPDWLVAEIVDQANGRPGLAAMLARLSLLGDVAHVYDGRALVDRLEPQIVKLVGPTALGALAAFGLAGDAGLKLEVAAEFLGVPQLELATTLGKLAAAGIIRASADRHISVWPEGFRYALVTQHFFESPGALDWKPLIPIVPILGELVRVLVAARARGARVIGLDELLDRTPSLSAWKAYALLGPAEATYALDRKPELLDSLAFECLHVAPAAVIPRILEGASRDESAVTRRDKGPLEPISRWIKSGRPGSPEALARRFVAIDAAERWISDGHDRAVAIQLILLAFSPEFDAHTTDPGRGMTVTLHFGVLMPSELDALAARWDKVKTAIFPMPDKALPAVRTLVNEWWTPSLGRTGTLPAESRRRMDAFIATVLQAMLDENGDRPGVLQWATSTASSLKLQLQAAVDPEYSTLFPPDRDTFSKSVAARQANEARALGIRWAAEQPRDVATRIKRFETEADLADHRYPRLLDLAAAECASQVADPLRWLGVMTDLQVGNEAVAPFVRASLSMPDDDFVPVVEALLASVEYRAITVLQIIQGEPSEAVLSMAIANAAGFAGGIEQACILGRVSIPIRKQLLQHPDERIAVSVAVAEWERAKHTETPIDASLEEAWRAAILRAGESVKSDSISHWLLRIFAGDAGLARAWMSRAIDHRNDKHLSIDEAELVSNVVQQADRDTRKQLLETVTGCYCTRSAVAAAIGDDLGLYRLILGRRELDDVHLVPLAGSPTGGWRDKAKAALAAGYSVEDVLHATIGTSFGWVGSEADMWEGKAKAFEALESDDDPRIREVGRSGHRILHARAQHARSEEQDEAMYGRPRRTMS